MQSATHPARAGAAPPLTGLLLVCAAGAIWGTIGPGVAIVHDRSGMSALAMGAYRSVAAVLVLGLAIVLTRRGPALAGIVRTHGRQVAGVGVLTALFQITYFVAVVSVGVSVATVIALGVPPVLLLALSSALARRRPSLGQVATVGAAVTGLGLVSFAGGGEASPADPALGIVMATVSGIAYGLSAEIGAPLSKAHDALAVTASTIGVAAVALVLGGLGLGIATGAQVTTSDPVSLGILAYLGVATMALAYVLLFAGLRTTPGRLAVVATLMEPVTAVLIAVAFLGEALTPAGVLGSLLIVGAIASIGGQLEEVPPPEPQ